MTISFAFRECRLIPPLNAAVASLRQVFVLAIGGAAEGVGVASTLNSAVARRREERSSEEGVTEVAIPETDA